MDQEISKLQYYSDKSQKPTTQRKYRKRKCKGNAHHFFKSNMLLFISFNIMFHLHKSRQKNHVLCSRKMGSCSICHSITSSCCLFTPWSSIAIAVKRKFENLAHFKLLYSPYFISVCLKWKILMLLFQLILWYVLTTWYLTNGGLSRSS